MDKICSHSPKWGLHMFYVNDITVHCFGSIPTRGIKKQEFNLLVSQNTPIPMRKAYAKYDGLQGDYMWHS
eukprot:100605-Ditylum_brightwellii.AAC.1